MCIGEQILNTTPFLLLFGCAAAGTGEIVIVLLTGIYPSL